jgi:ABC-2 type transport system ATP-binding protein
MNDSPLLCRGLRRHFTPGVPVLDGVDLEVRPGEIVGLVGRNGAGKSTLMKLALGLLQPHDGTVRVFGMNPVADPVEVKRRIGYAAEDPLLPPGSAVQDLLALHAELYPDWDARLAEELVHRFRLPVRRRMQALSRGQARQAALLCAVAHRPPLLLLDEPASGLDPAARREFLETSIELLAGGGSAILFSSHQMGDVERLAHRVAFLHERRIALECATDEVAARHSLAVVRGRWEAAQFARTPAVLRARRREDLTHVVLACAPDEATRALTDGFGCAVLTARQLPLEELFVELTGAER